MSAIFQNIGNRVYAALLALVLLAGCTDARIVHIQDELGQPVLGAIARMDDPAAPNATPQVVGVSDLQGNMRLTPNPNANYRVAKEGFTEAHFPGFELAHPVSSVDFTSRDGMLVLLLKPATDEPLLLDAKKMWQEGVLDPLKNMPLAPVQPPPDNSPANPNPAPAPAP
jgi:hypothetical protein